MQKTGTVAETIDGELIKTIRKVRSGDKYISTTLVEPIAFALDEDAGGTLHESLS